MSSLTAQFSWPSGRFSIWLSFLINLGLLVLAALWIGTRVYAFREYQMDMDEAIHASRGVDIATAVSRGSLADLWAETIKPDWYPPAHGYLLGSWFLVAGASTASARYYSTFCFFLLGLLLWFSAKQSFRINAYLYLIPTLFLLADIQHTLLASLSMLEVPAGLLALASLYFYVCWQNSASIINTILISIFAVLAFLTRYNYGLIVLAALALCYLWYAIATRREGHLPARLLRIAAGWVPALAILSVWLAGLGEWQWFVSYLNAQPAGPLELTANNLLYYVRQLFGTPSGWLPILLVLAGGYFWLRRRQAPAAILPYAMFFGVAFVTLTLRTQNAQRFGMVLFPPLWIIASGAAQEVFQRIKQLQARMLAQATLLTLLLVLAGANLYSLSTRLQTAYENTGNGVNSAYQFVAETLDAAPGQDYQLVMYGNNDDWSGPALHYFLQARCLETRPACKVQVLDEREINKGWPLQDFTPQERAIRSEQALSSADTLVLFSKEPNLPEGWVEADRAGFDFTRNKLGSKHFQVVVLHAR
jgi:hypothetical protein